MSKILILKPHIMKKQQLVSYEAPTTQRIDLRIESGILTVSGQNNTLNNAIEDNWGTL